MSNGGLDRADSGSAMQIQEAVGVGWLVMIFHPLAVGTISQPPPVAANPDGQATVTEARVSVDVAVVDAET